jgi:hypothetical protein
MNEKQANKQLCIELNQYVLKGVADYKELEKSEYA